MYLQTQKYDIPTTMSHPFKHMSLTCSDNCPMVITEMYDCWGYWVIPGSGKGPKFTLQQCILLQDALQYIL